MLDKKIEGYETTDEVWLAWFYVDGGVTPKAEPRVVRATVFSAEHSLVQIGDSTPRGVLFSEQLFRTEREAWGYCAARAALAAKALMAESVAMTAKAVASSAEAAV